MGLRSVTRASQNSGSEQHSGFVISNSHQLVSVYCGSTGTTNLDESYVSGVSVYVFVWGMLFRFVYFSLYFGKELQVYIKRLGFKNISE